MSFVGRGLVVITLVAACSANAAASTGGTAGNDASTRAFRGRAEALYARLVGALTGP